MRPKTLILTPKRLRRICIWGRDGGDITCEILGELEALLLYGDGFGRLLRREGQWVLVRDGTDRPGRVISEQHGSYRLMRNLQLGISYSVGKPASSMPLRELSCAHFDHREKFWTRFPPEGSKVTPPHKSVEFWWKDYCPMVFRHLRELFAVDPADYMLAICGNEALRELSSPGKSGSFFYLTQDCRFMIKTVKKSEVKVLIRMLPSYYSHVSQHQHSLVTKFFGVHCVKPVGGHKVRFVVMGNLFCSEYPIHRRFDLKGSSYGRTVGKFEGDTEETTTLKDLDLNYIFHLEKSLFQDLQRQIDLDCKFLETEAIMDYSLLVGLHFHDKALFSKMGLISCSMYSGGISRSQIPATEDLSMDKLLNDRKSQIRLGANMPARAELVSRSVSDATCLPARQKGEIYEVILNFGIIDILQCYNFGKKMEHAYKSLQADPTSISAVDPKLYSRRFRDFIQRIFVEDR